METDSVTMDHPNNNVWLDNGPRPAKQLIGMELQNGWEVENLSSSSETSTGGTFCVPYIVNSKTKGKAFLKAMDYSSSFTGISVMDKLYETIQNFRHERDLLAGCVGMSRVISLIDSGEAHINAQNQYEVVFYLIFELADSDIRAHVNNKENANIGQLLLLMHQVTVALQQLHNAQIAHLDIKPSNVLVFHQKGAKLADLGRSVQNGRTSPFDSLARVGDGRYAPPELLYPGVCPKWETHRLGCDFYLLGNLLFFLLTGLSLTQVLLNRLRVLNEFLHPQFQMVSYDEAFPYVNNVFLQIIRELRSDLESSPVSEIVDIVKQLCDPDPTLRGLLINRGTNRFSLQRLVSKFDLLHKRNKYFHLLCQPITQESSV